MNVTISEAIRQLRKRSARVCHDTYFDSEYVIDQALINVRDTIAERARDGEWMTANAEAEVFLGSIEVLAGDWRCQGINKRSADWIVRNARKVLV